MENFGGLLLLIFMFVVYFVPTGIAVMKHKKNSTAIFILNFFLGWTIVFWIVALVRGTMED